MPTCGEGEGRGKEGETGDRDSEGWGQQRGPQTAPISPSLPWLFTSKLQNILLLAQAPGSSVLSLQPEGPHPHTGVHVQGARAASEEPLQWTVAQRAPAEPSACAGFSYQAVTLGARQQLRLTATSPSVPRPGVPCGALVPSPLEICAQL